VKRFFQISRIIQILLALVFALSACSGEEVTPVGELATATETRIETPIPISTETPQATAMATATPTEEPFIAEILVSDQVLANDGQLTVDQILAEDPGWVVITSSGDDGANFLGYSAIEAGLSENLLVIIDPLKASPMLRAVLHKDEGEVGAFEYPGPDQPVRNDSEIVETIFEVDNQAILPAVTVSDQELSEEGQVLIDRVNATSPGWLALHIDEDGQPGKMLNFVPVMTGENENFFLPINWRVATPLLHAVLYEDKGEIEHFEDIETDPVVSIDGQPIQSSFEVVFPPDIFVMNQPLINDSLEVERVISYGPGWLAVYSDDGGSLGTIVGWAALKDGVNEQVEVPLSAPADTSLLHFMIHQDTDDIGQFEFPGEDPPVRHGDLVPNPVTIRTDGGNYLIVGDQELQADGIVTVAMAVLDVDAWIVIRATSDVPGEQGEIIGMQWIPAGINRNVSVEIDTDLATNTLQAILHIDSGGSQEFDYPDGLDFPMQRNRNFIQVLFELERDN
jgi:hypothetical protein